MPALGVSDGPIDVTSVYKFMNLYAIYQALVLHNPAVQNNPRFKCYEKYLKVNKKQFKALRDYWKLVKDKLDPTSYRSAMTINYIPDLSIFDILDMITFDIVDNLNMHFVVEDNPFLLYGDLMEVDIQ